MNDDEYCKKLMKFRSLVELLLDVEDQINIEYDESEFHKKVDPIVGNILDQLSKHVDQKTIDDCISIYEELKK